MRDKEITSSSCAMAEELVAYLYNEASEREAKDFESHLRTCASCEAELAAFGHLRSSIAVWRRQALGSVEFAASASETVPATVLPQPSALTALREFFALSPMWLRAATAFASLAICALVVWAAARVLEAPRVQVVEKVVEKVPTPAEVDALVAQRVREELAASGNLKPETISKETVAQVNEQKASMLAQSGSGRSGSAAARRASAPRRARAPRVSTQEYEELARDLQLVPTRDEDDLPRLIDLMDEAN